MIIAYGVLIEIIDRAWFESDIESLLS